MRVQLVIVVDEAALLHARRVALSRVARRVCWWLESAYVSKGRGCVGRVPRDMLP